ncbi:hypothetical protein Adt_42386 [Abeliophyllum distichum]|uniref:Uncharacterized protein n=1 Tax=Abeliophyllum distichum TaxID=126358 RepID=A0ABD1PRI5_9LAMI
MRKSRQLEKGKAENPDEEISSRDVLLRKCSRKPKHSYIDNSKKEFILFAYKRDYNLDLHTLLRKYFDEDTYYIKRVSDIPPLQCAKFLEKMLHIEVKYNHKGSNGTGEHAFAKVSILKLWQMKWGNNPNKQRFVTILLRKRLANGKEFDEQVPIHFTYWDYNHMFDKILMVQN